MIAVRTATGVSGVQPVSLRGEPAGKAITVSNGGFTIDLRAFAPASFVIGGTK